MLRLFKNRLVANGLVASALFDQDNFYDAFLSDLSNCRKELIIECPFMTIRRISMLLPILRKLRRRGVTILINTRDPAEHDDIYEQQALEAISWLQELGAHVLYTGGHHRKLAILDRNVLWEGSLNILSHNDSCEIMRKITSPILAEQMIRFLNI